MENFIIYFTADWCQPCRLTRPIVEALNMESESPKFFIVDTDEATQMKEDFNLTGVPTFVFIKNGEEVRREKGLQRKENLEEFLAYLEQ
jgi:thioredoxin 1